MTIQPAATKLQSGEPVVAIRDLSFRYGEGSTSFLALRGINLAIAPGEMVAITGASGSGKSTLMNLLGTLALEPEGELQLGGENPSELPNEELAGFRNRTIGFIFQQFHLLPRLSVLDNVMLPCTYAKPAIKPAERAKYQQRAMDLLARLGIADQANKKPPLLSGGQKQRVAIARALVMDPQILLADEPTGALDSRTSKEVLRIFAELNRDGKTVILITHDPEVTRVARRRIELKDGTVVADEAQPGLNVEAQVAASAGHASEGTKAKRPLTQLILPLAATLLAPWREAWQALYSARLRTALTSLGLVIGVSSITIMLTLGAAAQEIILGIFNQAGSDRVYIGLDYGASRSNGAGYWPGLDIDHELPALQNAFARYGRIVPLGGTDEQPVFAAGNQLETSIQPLYNNRDFVDEGTRIDYGRLITPYEFAHGARVAIVGSEFAEKMFPKNYPGRLSNRTFPLGETLSVRGKLQATLTIIGVVKKRDTTFESASVNARIYMPRTTFSNYTGERRATWIAVVPHQGVSHRWVADSVTNYLRMQTGLKYPFVAHVPEEIIGRIMLFIKVFQGLTALIGGLCILVGGIGIMNIMLVTITERVREIGLRKALGATERDVTRQFLTECILLCSVSGLIGVAIGSAFCNLVALVGHYMMPDTIPGKLLLDPGGIAAGLGTAIGAGLIFGMMPALKAAQLDPSEALRSE